MSTQTPEASTDVISRKLQELRGKIRRYLLLSGLAILIGFLCLAFWVTFGLDVLNFSYRKLDLPWQLRLLFAAAILGGGGTLLFQYLLRPLLKKLENRTLALLVERNYPELNDRLVTAVDVDPAELHNQPAQQMMFQQTRKQAEQILSGCEMQQLLNQKRLSRIWTVSGILLTSLVMMACFNQTAFARWTRGFVMLQPEYWERYTSLSLRVLAAPGDRQLEFEDRVYKHPRGEDFTLIVTVEQTRQPVDQIVILTQSTEDSSRLRMSKVNEQTFRITLANRVEDFQFWLVAGDFRNSVPYNVKMVETPEFDELSVSARYPEYTQLNLGQEPGGEVLPILGPTLELPLGTGFDFQASASKPLVKVEFLSEYLALELTPESLEYKYLSPNLQAPRTGQFTSDSMMWNNERTQFAFTATLTEDSLLNLVEEDQVPIPANQLVRIYLHDEDGVITREPIKLQFLGRSDQPPRIETELYGISSQVTRKARIPVKGLLKDDYGIASAWFDTTLPTKPAEDSEDPPISQVQQKRFELETPPQGEREFRLQRTDFEELEVFELLPLDLKLGDQFTLALAAEDGSTLPSPQRSTGQRYQFRIVTAEELLSGLHRRELNLRSRFEQILKEVKASRNLIAEVQTDAELATQAEQCERALYANRKNDSELQAIEAGFQALRLETVNNAVDSPEVLNRLDQSILSPLGVLLKRHFPRLDDQLQVNPPEIALILAEYDQAIRLMEQVLLEMRKLETFNEAIEMLKGIINEQKDVKQQTEEKRKNELLDLFDDF